MSDHYYSAKPTSERDEREIHAELLGHSLTFQTDAGVFSKKGIDFGSRLLIETAEMGNTTSVLDLGCGYGPIGIAIATAYPQVRVTLVDVNERAVQLAKWNAERNRVANRVELVVSDGFTGLAGRSFEQILFNPPIRTGKVTIYQLFAEAKEHLAPGGSLWIVIRKQQGATSARAELERIFTEVELVEQKKGYCIFQGVKY